MSKGVVTCLWMFALGVIPMSTNAAEAGVARGPLRLHPQNPRYFADDTGRVVYLTGSHTWNNLQDIGPSDPPPPFDFAAYLDFLERYHHNFIRLWRWELLVWDTQANNQPGRHYAAPHPWPRTGPGTALDGKPRFNLSQFDTAYFQRLRSRVEAAYRRGIYVSIMLFEGWGMQFVPDAWKAHPFHPQNNTGGIPEGVQGLEIFTLAHPAVTAIQEAYVRKVVDTVNDLDNVLYEISNENHPPSTEWQYHMIRFIRNYEKGKPKQHPIGMTFQYKGGSNTTLFQSPADWISPNPEGGYRDNPPPADGRKVVLNDTDHLWGIGGNVAWVWKSFLRGHYPIFMDPYEGQILGQPKDPKWEPVRRALGATRRLAERFDLARLLPHGELASTGFCLAHPGKEYVAYQAEPGAPFSVTLQAGRYRAEWIDPQSADLLAAQEVTATGGSQSFKPPKAGDAVLYLRALP